MTISLSPVPSLTVENVANVMEKVTEDKRRRLWESVLGESGESHIEEVYRSCSGEMERTFAFSDTYVKCRPESSWEHLVSVLYEEDEMNAVDLARPFLPPRG